MSLITEKDIEFRAEAYAKAAEKQFRHHQDFRPGQHKDETGEDYLQRRRSHARVGYMLSMHADAAELHLRAALIMQDQANIEPEEARRLAATLMSRTVVEE